MKSLLIILALALPISSSWAAEANNQKLSVNAAYALARAALRDIQGYRDNREAYRPRPDEIIWELHGLSSTTINNQLARSFGYVANGKYLNTFLANRSRIIRLCSVEKEVFGGLFPNQSEIQITVNCLAKGLMGKRTAN